MIHPWATYQSIPFEDKGRTFRNCDCWGLVRLILTTELGFSDLPTYGETSAFNLIKAAREINHEAGSTQWLDIAKGKQHRFDVCLMATIGTKRISHVGIMTNGTHVLHTEKGVGAAIVPINHFMIKERVLGFRRFNANA